MGVRVTAGSMSGGGGGAGLIHQATIRLNNSQIIHLPQTPILIVAGIANKTYVLLAAHMNADPGSGSANGYLTVNANCTFQVTDGSGTAASESPFQGSTLSSTWSWERLLLPHSAVANSRLQGGSTFSFGSSFYIEADNMGDGIFTGGDAQNTLRVSVAYLIIDPTTGIFS